MRPASCPDRERLTSQENSDSLFVRQRLLSESAAGVLMEHLDLSVASREERCYCGNLVARISPAGVEILCRRCRRIHRIPWIREEMAMKVHSRPYQPGI